MPGNGKPTKWTDFDHIFDILDSFNMGDLFKGIAEIVDDEIEIPLPGVDKTKISIKLNSNAGLLKIKYKNKYDKDKQIQLKVKIQGFTGGSATYIDGIIKITLTPETGEGDVDIPVS